MKNLIQYHCWNNTDLQHCPFKAGAAKGQAQRSTASGLHQNSSDEGVLLCIASQKTRCY